MKWFLDLSVKAKLYLGFSVLTVFLGGAIVTAQRNISAMRESQKALFEIEFANTVDSCMWSPIRVQSAPIC